MLVAAAAPVGAQDDVPADGVNTSQQEIDAARIDVVRDDSTSDTIQRIRRDLAIVAATLTGALAIYIWHTSPSRRLRVASRRAAADIDHDDDGGPPNPGPDGRPGLC